MLYDIIIVGGGIAGMMAAIEAKTDTNKVAIMTKGNIFKSNSAMASGGINAVLDSNDKDKLKQHIDDTLKGGFGLSNKNAVTYMCNKAPEIINTLVQYGVDFDKTSDGKIAQRSFGGTQAKRTCYVGDKTGSAIMQVLIKKAKELGIAFLVNHFAMNITSLHNRVSGIVALRKIDSSIMVYPTKSVILAGGGYAGIYRGFSTNTQDYSGDILAIALRAGLNLKDMEFVQFHPTGLDKTSYLVSEAARGEGAYLINDKNERFVNELETRNIVSFAISKQIESGRKVFIDLRHISLDIIKEKLPALYQYAYNQVGIDISTELLAVKPVAHYSMGGIEANMTKTKIKGLFVCGECAVNGIHGANRLGGNSLLEGAVFGSLAGKKSLTFSQHKEYLPIDYNIVLKDQKLIDWIFAADTTKNFNAMRISMGKTMFDLVGIHRSEKSLNKAFNYLKYLRHETISLHCIDKGTKNNVELSAILELKNALEVAEAVVMSALYRKESRGAHNRDDFTEKNKNLSKSILINEQQKGYFKVWYEDKKIVSILKNLLIHQPRKGY